jgi:hypothetical protein
MIDLRQSSGKNLKWGWSGISPGLGVTFTQMGTLIHGRGEVDRNACREGARVRVRASPIPNSDGRTRGIGDQGGVSGLGRPLYPAMYSGSEVHALYPRNLALQGERHIPSASWFRVKGGRFQGCPTTWPRSAGFTTGTLRLLCPSGGRERVWQIHPSDLLIQCAFLEGPGATLGNLIRSDERRRGDSIEDQEKGKKWLQNASS